MVTPAGIGVWAMLGDPSRRVLTRRMSMGSMPSASASLFTWHSTAKAACGAPKPRNAPPGVALVYTTWVSMAALGSS